MELISNYSGIAAIIVYGILLSVLLGFNKNKKKKIVPEAESDFAALDISDEEALVACLTAAIDCREQEHQNVRIIGVRRLD